jgi:hypothetical protein
VPALDRLHGARVVADPAALNALVARSLPAGALALRLAPDDLFIIDVDADSLRIEDAHAIAVDDAGWVGAWCGFDAVAPHVEWQPPVERPALVQGSIAGVPAKLWLPDDGDALLLTAAPYASTLAERLGWHA